MSDIETHSREALEGMSRLVLRRICKARGMSSEDCSKMEFDDMVEWILEQQDGGGGGGVKKSAPKGGKKAPPKGGKKAPPKGGKKAPPKAAPRSEDTEEDTGEVAGDDLANLVLEKLNELGDRMSAVEEKVDTLGEVVDQNIAGLVTDAADLRADTYKITELAMHFYRWARADGILTDDAAPEGLDFDDKAAAIDEECGGNEEGDE